MDINRVDPVLVGTPEPHKGGINFLFVRVETSDGLVGWGECPWIEYRGRTMAALIDELAAVFLDDVSPFAIEELRRRLYRSNHSLHVPGPLQAQAIAGIEMACWDLVGKHVGEPVYNLLGGRINDAIRTYTYLHYEWHPPDKPAAAAEAASDYVDQGFTGIKLDPVPPYDGPRALSPGDRKYAADVVAAVREAVGDEVAIIIGTHGQLTTHSAIELAAELEPHDPLWFEEPVPPERPDEMAKVAAATSIPIASGERLTTIHQAGQHLAEGAVDVIQPNVGMLGLLEARKVAGMAQAQYAQVAPWLYCGPVAAAANIHLDVCTPNFLIQESIEQLDEFHAEILEEPLTWEAGYLEPPTDPGLGVAVDEAVAAEHEYNEIGPDEFSWF